MNQTDHRRSNRRRPAAGLLRGGLIASFAGLLWLTFGSGPRPADAAEILKCDGIAKQEVAAAAVFIDQNLDAIVNAFTWLTAKQRDEFRKKWPKVKVVCKDDGHTHCLKKPSVTGYSHGGPGNRIRVCYYNAIEFKRTLCDMVGTLVHEMGHANGYPKMKGHNNPTAKVYAQDPIYKMGTAARTICETQAKAGKVTNSNLSGVAQRAIGDACTKNDQCASGKCSNQNKCVCTQDSHCQSGEKCYKPIGKQNYCESTSKPLGSTCNKNSQCRSNKCEQKACVCKADSDCPNGQKCFTPLTKKNYCESTSKPLGSACKKNAECRSNKCEQKACVCKADSDCPSGQKCFTPLTKKNYCESTSKPLGSACKKNAECRSGKCEQKECVCKQNSDCPTGQKCKTPITGKNRCK